MQNNDVPKLTIAILSPAHPLRGGIAASTERLATALLADGHQVRIYSYKLQYPDWLFPGKTQYSDDPAPEGLHIEPIINTVDPLNWMTVGRRLSAEAPDLVIVRYWLPFLAPALGTILRRVRRNGHTRVIAITDNIIPHEKRPGDNFLTGYFLKAVDGVIVMSRSVLAEIRQFSRTLPVSYVPHPIYDNYGHRVDRATALHYLGLSPDYRYLLFFGFVRAYKGLDLLLWALADERLRKMPLRLIVAGEFYEEQERYEALLDKLNLRDRVIIRADFIPAEEVRYYFGAADLIVQPYRSATQSGISQMAYHFEKPMLVTRVGGLPEIIEDGVVGYVVEIDPKPIAEAIVDFFAGDRKATFTEGVRRAKDRFSWESLVEGIQGMYQQLAESLQESK